VNNSAVHFNSDGNSSLIIKISCCVHAVDVKQQLQKPTTERVLLDDLHLELRSLVCHFWETGRLVSLRV